MWWTTGSLTPLNSMLESAQRGVCVLAFPANCHGDAGRASFLPVRPKKMAYVFTFDCWKGVLIGIYNCVLRNVCR